MKLQKGNLSPESQGADVKLLQTELGQLGFLIAGDEREQGMFGKSTLEAVRQFQEQNKLVVTGVVDEVTATQINRHVESLQPPPTLAEEHGSIAGSNDSGQFILRGTVRRSDRSPSVGVLVRAFVQGSGLLAGDAVSGSEGEYEIKYSAGSPDGSDKSAPDLIVRVYELDAKHEATMAALASVPARFGAGPVEVVDVLLPEPDLASFVVEGKVSSSRSAALGGLRVRIVDKNVGGDVPLIDAVSDEKGLYRGTFTDTQWGKRGKAKPDLQARVFAGATFLAASAVRYNASSRETLDVFLDQKASSALPSEYDTLVETLSRQFAGKLSELQESDGRQDITYLANKTGWDARAVAMTALADKFSQRAAQAEIPPVFFYALFRAGLPANEDILYRATPVTVSAIWNRAVAQGIISNSLAAVVADVAERFRSLSAQKWLAAPALVGPSSCREMLIASGLDASQQQKFAELYTKQRTDLAAFWQAVESEFGEAAASRLQVDGKLASLTINNGPLIEELHATAGGAGLSNSLQLAQLGFHRTSRWAELLAGNVVVPKEIPGITLEAKRLNYAEYLAAQIRLSYPTAAVAEMVKTGELAVSAAEEVHAFLTEQQGKFEIGMQPIQQYLAKNQIQLDENTLRQVKRLQCVYQITPSDRAMAGLLNRGIYAAYHVVGYEKEAFVAAFAEDLGGSEVAQQVFDRAQQVHNAVLNVVISYQTAKNGFALGALPLELPTRNRAVAQRTEAAPPLQSSQPDPSQVLLGRDEDIGRQILQPAPAGPTAANATDVIAYPTLEGLFGELDFCQCEHCRSILSPAAYLVDLLLFLKGADSTPLGVFLERRPDVQHLPLTCENTHTALPYIDLVNEMLEFFVANAALNAAQSPPRLPLTGYAGHDTGSTASEDLLASPQSVIDSAYETLAGQHFPMPLPFHQPLESLRRYFAKFEVPLSEAMELLCKSAAADVDNSLIPPPPPTPASSYAWRDIWMEELGLSRAEYAILTASRADILSEDRAVPLWRMYGFPPGTADAEVISLLSNAKEFSRRLGITYEDIVAVLRTRFINPSSYLIPKLERLAVSFTTLDALHRNAPGIDADFNRQLPTGAAMIDVTAYGGDKAAWEADHRNYAPVIRAWLSAHQTYERIMSLITLIDPSDNPDPCSFDHVEFRYPRPTMDAADPSSRIGQVEFVRLMRFIRLWKKLGWTIEQTDAALCALFPAPTPPQSFADAVSTVSNLDAGFNSLLPRLGILSRVMRRLNLTPDRDLLALLACWSAIGTQGDQSLYRQMFLNPTVLGQDPTFAENGYGEFLVGSETLDRHTEALRAAFNLTRDEYQNIFKALRYHETTPLKIEQISAIFRWGWLARRLRLSVRELLSLTEKTGLDPFAAPSPTDPAILQLISLVQALRNRSLAVASALYLIWNQDLSGKSAPTAAQVRGLARELRHALAAVESEFAVKDDPDGSIAQSRMALVYGVEAAAFFFGLLNDTFSVEVSFDDPDGTLNPGNPRPVRRAIDTAAGATDAGKPRIGFDPFRKRLSYTGVLAESRRDQLIAAAGRGADAFIHATGALYTASEAAIRPFFVRYPELELAYDLYVTPTHPPTADFARRSALLKRVLPQLVKRRKAQQVLQTISSATGSTFIMAQTLLDPPAAPYPLHAGGDNTQPGLVDLVNLETRGLSVAFTDVATGAIIPTPSIATTLDYNANNPLPANPTPAGVLSGSWHGYVEVPENGLYALRIETDPEAVVGLYMDGTDFRPRRAAASGNWIAGQVELRAGTLFEIKLTVANVRNRLRVVWDWEPKGQGRAVIPAQYLYPASSLRAFQQTYLRFLKAASLAAGLEMTANEIAHFATATEYQINHDGWVNVLPVTEIPDQPLAAALLRPFQALLGYARIKTQVAPRDESLLKVLKDPTESTIPGDSLLYTLTGWNASSLTALLTHFQGFAGFAGTITDLKGFDRFQRVHEAFALIQKMGVSAGALIQATTNEPSGATVGALQAALRARYDTSRWREVVQPINDTLRGLQRDALVNYILHWMRSAPATAHIDTPNKLFEYFLIDVEMEPCMQTSRVRHALSSVQLFIERCLMNLESRVAPSALNARQWLWMKRYRIWEANRQVFLFPENWLEPELRDDKSPFFKEAESELLQKDITEDSAARALLNYLSKLEEVAKLEPCGIYHVEANPAQHQGQVDHVVARTAGASRKYYYRRREGATWTSWEQVRLDIEDNPVTPVVWNGRLFLFWLRILAQVPVDQGLPSISTGSTRSFAEVVGALQNTTSNVRVTVNALLCWSEYYNGQWQAAKTSDAKKPTRLESFPPDPLAFDRSRLVLRVEEEEKALRVRIYGNGASSFLLYNTHSLPVRAEDQQPAGPALNSQRSRYMTPSSSSQSPRQRLSIWYSDSAQSLDLERHPISSEMSFHLIEPFHPLRNPWSAPFFLEDTRHAFFVTTKSEPGSLESPFGYGISIDPYFFQDGNIPPVIPAPEPHPSEVRTFPGDGQTLRFDPGVIDPGPIEEYLSRSRYIRHGLGTAGMFNYDNVIIGPAGTVPSNGHLEKENL